MYLLVNLSNPKDVQDAHTLLSAGVQAACVPPVPPVPPDPPVPSDSADALDREFVNHLWPRLGPKLRGVVKQARTYEGKTTIDRLAADLHRSETGCRNGLNGALRKAIVSAMNEVPGSQGLFDWHFNVMLGRWEFAMRAAIKHALDGKAIED
jgi:hypothetical protein